MKKFKLNLAYLAMFAMIFTSCSKEETGEQTLDSEKASLSFGAIVTDLVANRAASKQSIGEMPLCSDTEPAYVRVVLLNGDVPVLGTTANPYRIDLVAGEVFTEEDPNLELEPDTYTLDHFAVYNAANQLIWLAPRGGDLAHFVESPLPMDIDLRAGVKKYVEVDVLCYDNRDVVEYGYLFFDIDTNAAIKFCIFGNYCPPSGRHFPAQFSVDVWSYADGQQGALLHENLTNTVEIDENGDYAGTTVCMALPDTEGLDEYYFEITLLDSDAYGDIQERIIRSGVINDDEVKLLFDGENNLDYYHFREGCGEDNPPIFQDPEDDALSYKACLLPVNGSTALGFAYITVAGDQMDATIIGVNLEEGERHAQDIYGGENGGNATCPPSESDELLLALTTESGEYPLFTNADGTGILMYQRSFTLGQDGVISAEDLGALEDRSVVFSEIGQNGDPIACGEIFKL